MTLTGTTAVRARLAAESDALLSGPSLIEEELRNRLSALAAQLHRPRAAAPVPGSVPAVQPVRDPFAATPRIAVFVRDSLAVEYAVRTAETQALSRVIRGLTSDPTEARWSSRDQCWRIASYLSGRLAERLRTDGWVVAGDRTW
ncbi:hypothetical protein [Nocardia testacea]|uniref:hypothetical protein n=1 Tax=Nocardia testacea TaxID=248551 RepID=UPI0002DD15DC|nr:hypothetical protein [Nocardia testacea]